MKRPLHILYVAPQLPKRSETFVYRELFALRRLNMRVSAASLHAPERGLGDDALERLADETFCLYGNRARLAGDVLAELACHPVAAVLTLAQALRDAVCGSDLRGTATRAKVLWHGVVGLALARRARRMGVTHIHAHFAHVSASVAMYAARQTDCAFSFTGHAADLFRDRVLLSEKLSRAAFVSCISYWHRTFYRSLVDRPDASYPVVRCGVDLTEFAPTPPRTEKTVRVVSVGRLVEKKGFDVLLQALSLLKKKEGAFACCVLGDGPEMNALSAQTRALGLSDAVVWKGAASNAEVREALRDADLFVLPCRASADGDRDGIPVALMEAMACGVCAVSGDLPTIRELIENETCGYLVPPNDAAALLNLLRRLIQNPELRARAGAAGRERVAAEFSVDVNGARLQKAFAALAT